MNKPSVVIPLVVVVDALGLLGQAFLERAIDPIQSGTGPWTGVGPETPFIATGMARAPGSRA